MKKNICKHALPHKAISPGDAFIWITAAFFLIKEEGKNPKPQQKKKQQQLKKPTTKYFSSLDRIVFLA